MPENKASHEINNDEMSIDVNEVHSVTHTSGICPECKEEITKVHMWKECIAEYTVTVDVDDGLITALPYDYHTGDIVHFTCPICEDIIAPNYAEVKQILRRTK